MTDPHDFQRTAIHEAAHVISALHWGVPVGRRGVRLRAGTHGGAAGFSHMRWNAMPKTKPMTHAYRVHMLIAPFAERQFLANSGHAESPASLRRMMELIEQSRADFGAILGLERARVVDCRTREKKTAMLYGSVCFMLRARREPGAWLRSVSPETATMTRKLVRDTDTMLRAYWDQITAFADALLSADKHRLSARDVNAWRDAHFQQRDISFA